jgi:hypothetical protein
MNIILHNVHRLEVLKYDVSETGSVYVIRCEEGKVPAQVAPI